MKKLLSSTARNYIVVALLAYLFFLLATLPASMVTDKWFKTKIPSYLQLSGVSGTIWSGKAKYVQLKGISLGKMEWRLSVLPLLWGNIAAHIKTKSEMSHSGFMASLGNETVNIKNVEFQFPISMLSPLFYALPVKLDGDIRSQLKTVDIKKDDYFIADGRIVISGLNLIAPQAMNLGQFVIVMSPDGKGSNIIVSDDNGPLQTNVQIRVLPTGEYSLTANLLPRNGNGKLKQGLSMFARADAQGVYHLSYKGRIPL